MILCNLCKCSLFCWNTFSLFLTYSLGPNLLLSILHSPLRPKKMEAVSTAATTCWNTAPELGCVDLMLVVMAVTLGKHSLGLLAHHN